MAQGINKGDRRQPKDVYITSMQCFRDTTDLIEKDMQLSHTALLVPSVEKAAARLKDLGFAPAPAEVWEGEGTKEIYVGRGRVNALLLMEPCREGSYSRALTKRGPGLHHQAVDVPDLDGFLAAIAGSGWLLHPNSVATMKRSRTAYLARPGFPALIEAQERKEPAIEGKPFVSELRLPLSGSWEKLAEVAGLRGFLKNADELSLRVGAREVRLSELL